MGFQPIPESLHQPHPRAVSLHELAARLEVPTARLLPLIKHGYIRVICPDPPTVYEPPPAAIEWLKSALTPLAMRPFLGIEEVAEMEDVPASEIRRIALAYDVPLQVDPVFGEVFSLSGFRRLHNSLHYQREPSRFDRLAWLTVLLRTVDPKLESLEAPNFSKRLEGEVRRIAQLEEPHRTEQALRLWEQMTQAKKVADSIAKAKGLGVPAIKGMQRVERLVAVSDAETPSEEGAL
jgi:hypothetical protein